MNEKLKADQRANSGELEKSGSGSGSGSIPLEKGGSGSGGQHIIGTGKGTAANREESPEVEVVEVK